jgi:branched-chain amino acid transport system ATP-binding protein
VSLLSVQDVHTYYGKSFILQGVSLDLDPGRVVAVLGRNGVGKTTLLRSIMGFVPCRQGQIRFNGTDITLKRPHLKVREGIGYVPQGRQIFPSLTVKENLLINSRPPAGNGEVLWDLDKVLATFPRLEQRLSHKGGQLSGGEQQMLAIARALIGNPSLLIMDEPTEGLAPLIVREIATLIASIKAQGISVLLVEQNFNFAVGAADYVYLMQKGLVVYQSEPAQLVADREAREKYLGV